MEIVQGGKMESAPFSESFTDGKSEVFLSQVYFNLMLDAWNFLVASGHVFYDF